MWHHFQATFIDIWRFFSGHTGRRRHCWYLMMNLSFWMLKLKSCDSQIVKPGWLHPNVHSIKHFVHLLSNVKMKESSRIKGQFRYILIFFLQFYFLMGQPRPLFHFCCLFQIHITIFPTNKCEKCPCSIWCRDSNSQPLEHESPPKTTRPLTTLW